MWFILDELPALQKVSSLPVALAESRKYGGCFVAGLQNIHQLEAIYGSAECASMLDLFNRPLSKLVKVVQNYKCQRSN
nr:type IV secretion system DNA-binding domain-containing protein [Orientia tsutsugamushi]